METKALRNLRLVPGARFSLVRFVIFRGSNSQASGPNALQIMSFALSLAGALPAEPPRHKSRKSILHVKIFSIVVFEGFFEETLNRLCNSRLAQDLMQMGFDYLKLSDFEIRDKKILLRLDINSPMDPKTNRILDNSRILAAKPSLEALRDARVVVMAHQSRPGKGDFTSLQQHADLLKTVCSQPVRFVEDVMGPSARMAINETNRGEVLVLDNVRFCAEENLEDKGEKLAKSNLVSRLAPLFDLYVNDAFASAHRSQASVVGFPTSSAFSCRPPSREGINRPRPVTWRTQPAKYLPLRRRED